MCNLTWKENTTRSENSYFRLLPSMPSTEETESSLSPTAIPLWPTPTVKGNYNKQGLSKKSGDGLATAVKKMWPTPTTRDHKGGYVGGRIRNGKVSWDTLDVAVQHTDNQSKTAGALNPTWVEWLMGFPTGWTDSKD